MNLMIKVNRAILVLAGWTMLLTGVVEAQTNKVITWGFGLTCFLCQSVFF